VISSECCIGIGQFLSGANTDDGIMSSLYYVCRGKRKKVCCM